ncbi:hypothetical protein [Cohnella zeiphila]|uniref:Uncharacterized protein n=1 Tax=Cohnella zeiphila TaxID=2761120 RepID=A0A7X0STE6_9BACL|nr:hypothetical protein [Cohnella zeiphila]MBB6735781.1 hypothetical protein [Cohnella zeiphila]
MNRMKGLRGAESRFSAIERWIVRLIGALVAALLISQLALRLPVVHELLTGTEQWEGVRFPER